MHRAAVGSEVEHVLFAVAADVQVAVGDDHLVVEGLRLHDDAPGGIDDARSGDQRRTVLDACLGDGTAQVAFM